MTNVQTSPQLEMPSFKRASLGFLASTVGLCVVMIALSSL